MSDKTGIEWTEATWNPVTGCTKISQGCKYCYAQVLSERFRETSKHYFENGFDLTLRENKLLEPMKWKVPRKIFVNSMSDLFHKDVPDQYIRRVFKVMEEANHHIYQILTKRATRMKTFINKNFKKGVPAHIWLGVSVEDEIAKKRIIEIRKCKAAIKFISFEPLIADTKIKYKELDGIDWVIVGGGIWVQSKAYEIRMGSKN